MHGAAYAIRHQRLVKAFLEKPAQSLTTAHGSCVTSSGPPLDQVMAMLQRLLDLRAARDRPGVLSASAAIARIQMVLQ